MADDINKKISIDIEINTDGQQEINQYKDSFDNLRSTLNNLSRPLNDTSRGVKSLDKNVSDLSEAFNKLNGSTSSFDSIGNKIRDVASSSLASFNGLQQALLSLKISLGAFEAEITAGISLLIAFAPEITKWIGNLFKAGTATKSLTQALKEQKSIVQAVTQARQQGDQNAQEELVHLKLLYSASQDQNLSLTERKKAVNELQSQYPGYFSNLSIT